ncbi:unnamed protein product [Lymnaea stagnalis]|uniref:Cyclic nucleotide-binding domain-containing protein n=1 Tax=Lymnaea stagnalis TaxID=6523 RepID=A0AAV2IE79_LYMST
MQHNPLNPVPHQLGTFPRGILKTANTNKEARVGSTDQVTTAVDHDAKAAHTLRPESGRRDTSENQRRMLKVMRWSESDISRGPMGTPQRTRKLPAVGPPPGLGRVRSEFNPYDFYTRVNANHGMISEAKDKRLMPKTSDPGFKGHELKLRSAFFSNAKTEERLKEWTHEAYKNKMMQMFQRDPDGLGRLLQSSMSRATSRKTSAVDQFPEIIISRRSSQTNRPVRRGSVFWVPPSYDHLTEVERKQKRDLRKFRWYGLVIRCMCGLLMDMKKLSISKTQQSAHSEFLYIIAGPKTHAGQEGQGTESQHLLFDKSWFNRNRAWSRMPEWAQGVMQLPPDERTPDQIHHLKQLLMNMKSFRENLTDEMRDKMCQVVRYTKCDKGRVVLRQGHVGFDFYFIFSGSVFIQIDVYDEKNDTTFTNVENVLRTGEGFGEIALLGDGRRTASVICKEPTELCQIDKMTFLDLCPVLFNQQLQDKIDFARQFPLFEFWDQEMLRRLCFLSQVLDVPHSTVVEVNWATTNYAYFVMNGRLSMLKEFDVTEIVEKSSQTRGNTHVSSKKVVEGQRKKSKYTKFAHVGMLQKGQCSELAVLSIEPPKNLTRITLVSEGVKLFRVAVRTFLRISPRKNVEEYLKKVYKSPTFPLDEELRSMYVKDRSWAEFKRNIINTHQLERNGDVIASIPATLKGSTGWAKWPGYAVIPRLNKPQPKVESSSEVGYDESYEGDSECEPDDNDDDKAEVDAKPLKVVGADFLGPVEPDVKELSLTNDRTLTMPPPHTETMTTWRKNLANSDGLTVCNYVFGS